MMMGTSYTWTQTLGGHRSGSTGHGGRGQLCAAPRHDLVISGPEVDLVLRGTESVSPQFLCAGL